MKTNTKLSSSFFRSILALALVFFGSHNITLAADQLQIKRATPYDNAIEMTVIAQEMTSVSQYYKMACLSLYSEDWTKAKTTTTTPSVSQDTVALGIYDLQASTDYQCYTALMDNDKVALRTLTMAITTTVRGKTATHRVSEPGQTGQPLGTQVFTDINTNSVAGKSAQNLFHKGIISGYPDGSFRGDNPVNRAEAAKFLVNSLFDELPDTDPTPFLDVQESEWYAPYVAIAFQEGWIQGYDSGLYHPGNTINTAEFLKILSEAFAVTSESQLEYYDVPADAWFAPYVRVATQYDLMPMRGKYNLDPSRDMTRAEVAIAIDRLIRALE